MQLKCTPVRGQHDEPPIQYDHPNSPKGKAGSAIRQGNTPSTRRGRLLHLKNCMAERGGEVGGVPLFNCFVPNACFAERKYTCQVIPTDPSSNRLLLLIEEAARHRPEPAQRGVTRRTTGTAPVAVAVLMLVFVVL